MLKVGKLIIAYIKSSLTTNDRHKLDKEKKIISTKYDENITIGLNILFFLVWMIDEKTIEIIIKSRCMEMKPNPMIPT